MTAPADSRLPSNISGQTLCGFYDIKPTLFGQVNNLVTLASNFGNQTEVYNGGDLTVNIRLPRGATVRWTNYAAVQHTVTEGSPDSVTPPVFESPYLSTLGVYELAFPQPGEWRYYCFTHPLIMKDCFVRVR